MIENRDMDWIIILMKKEWIISFRMRLIHSDAISDLQCLLICIDDIGLKSHFVVDKTLLIRILFVIIQSSLEIGLELGGGGSF
jgi:hypothetical protein